jgi:hypothetical protein
MKGKARIIRCPCCKRRFKQKRYWQKFCKERCRIKYWKENIFNISKEDFEILQKLKKEKENK